MTRSALIESLRSQAARDAQAVWDEARAEVQRRQAEADRALQEERGRLDAALEAETREIESRAGADAAHKAREAAAGSAVTLADRLLALACAELPGLVSASRVEAFAALARELPRCRWECARVNPADADLATQHFPGARVETDPAISGGMDVVCEDGRIAVSNTLETRLAMAWPDLLPGLLAELMDDGGDHGIAA